MNFKCSVFVVFLVCHVINGQGGPKGPKGCKQGCIPKLFCPECPTSGKCKGNCVENSCTQNDACTAAKGRSVPTAMCGDGGCSDEVVCEEGCGCKIFTKPTCPREKSCKKAGGKCVEECVEDDLTFCGTETAQCGDACSCAIKPKPTGKCKQIGGKCKKFCDTTTGVACNEKWCKGKGFSCEYLEPQCELLDSGCAENLQGECVGKSECTRDKDLSIGCIKKGCGGPGCVCKFTKVSCEQSDCEGICVPTNKCREDGDGKFLCDPNGCGGTDSPCTCKTRNDA